ncbi:sugar phosphate isomerase/epimerase family protein [Alkalibacterium olivapovliticus]|uniref:Inosose dehydratase n=1 Tax=Alkalibacterium olivapovliticus TaxID=99907 RepID=A0A2T0W703_9LACT|nr:TIM barrel protein [Alkalibacterium olivapovliticus]PRY82476.1 inosose dehydratase [Alkalibacterium olivapovliticus]
MTIKFGCQGSTWVLNYDIEADVIDQLMDDVQNAGFEGIDIQVALLGKYREHPEKLKKELDNRGLELAALTLPTSFKGGEESDAERKDSEYYMDYLKHFPGALLNVPSRVEESRDNLEQRQKEIIEGANKLGKRAKAKGIITSIHPISYETSYFRFKDDYDRLLQGLNPDDMGYTPDVGHLTFGDIDAVELIKEYRPLIRHVHFKDATYSKEWKKMGTGDIDFKGCVQALVDTDYDGWIMVEEETELAQKETRKVIKDISDYVNRELKPIIEAGKQT